MRFSKKFLKKEGFFGHLVLFTFKNNHFWDLFLNVLKIHIINIFSQGLKFLINQN